MEFKSFDVNNQDSTLEFLEREKIIKEAINYILSKEELKKIFEQFSPQEQREIVIFLLSTYKVKTVDEFKTEEYDNIIEKHIKLEIIGKNSIRGEQEPEKYVEVKTRKKMTTKDIINSIILALIISGMIKIGIEFIKDSTIFGGLTHDDISQKIGALAAEPGSEDYIHQKPILFQNKYKVGVGENNFPIIAYDPYGIAKDIITVTKQNNALFDLCIYDIYFDMNTDSISNMNDVFFQLELLTKNNPELSFINERVKYGFLNYLINEGFMKENKDYNELLQDIANFKGYEKLTPESKERIDDLIKSYKKVGRELYKEGKVILKEMGLEGEGLGR